MSDRGYRDLHLRFHDSGYIETITRDDRARVGVDLLRLSRAIAKDYGIVGEVMNRPIDEEVQRVFDKFVKTLCDLIEEAIDRRPTFKEIVRDLHELLPWMTHDELMMRLKKAGWEVPA